MADENLSPGDGMHEFAIKQIKYFQDLNKKEREDKIHEAKAAQKKVDAKDGPTKDVVKKVVENEKENVTPTNAPSVAADAIPTPAPGSVTTPSTTTK